MKLINALFLIVFWYFRQEQLRSDLILLGRFIRLRNSRENVSFDTDYKEPLYLKRQIFEEGYMKSDNSFAICNRNTLIEKKNHNSVFRVESFRYFPRECVNLTES